MPKPLRQITFDFETENAENVSTITVIEEKPEQLMAEPVIELKIEKTETPKVVSGKRGRRSLKDAGTQADLIQVPEDEMLFKKQYYSIGEVAGMFRENQSLIRYWETEFDIL